MNIENYLAEAEENFSSFDGANDLDFDGGWYGAEGDVAAPQNLTSPSPYQISIVNSTAGALTAIIFGKNQFLLSTNFGSPVGITITPSQTNISYLELLNQSAEQPFETSLVRIQSTNTAQVTNIVNITTKDANGQECTVPLITQSYFSANQFQAGIIDVPYSMKIDGNTSMAYSILPTTTVILTFFPREKVNPARALTGRNAIKGYQAPAVPVITPNYPASYPAPQIGG
jgi:hypothetical protein